MDDVSYILSPQLTGPAPMMLWTAAIIETYLGNYVGMGVLLGVLLGIQFVNVRFYENLKVGNALAARKFSLRPVAVVKRDGMWQNIDAACIVPGDLVLLAAGSKVPADCYLNMAEIEVDQSFLTGQYQSVRVHRGDICQVGSLVTKGEMEGTVHTTGRRTAFGELAAMLQSVKNVGCRLIVITL